MSSELPNSLTTICSIMKMKLYNYVDKFVAVYLGGIVTYSESLETHLIHLSWCSQAEGEPTVYKE